MSTVQKSAGKNVLALLITTAGANVFQQMCDAVPLVVRSPGKAFAYAPLGSRGSIIAEYFEDNISVQKKTYKLKDLASGLTIEDDMSITRDGAKTPKWTFDCSGQFETVYVSANGAADNGLQLTGNGHAELIVDNPNIVHNCM